MTEHKFFAKAIHIQKSHHGGLPRLLVITQAGEHVEIVMGEAQMKLIENEVEAPCA